MQKMRINQVIEYSLPIPLPTFPLKNLKKGGVEEAKTILKNSERNKSLEGKGKGKDTDDNT
uniref:Uncharacterized protein n=1 Tax=Nelumbo nucifera TaxID=4432 RepID=A0A822ZSM2_NELNU|nr:TPA_asm: hypothetical protein HUJ06_017820 [Nelumbo nucifera]